MFEGLHAIDWAALNHAYGPADDVPACFEALLSPEAAVRQEALETLFAVLCSQGMLFPASLAAVPFLIELCAYEPAADREQILALLDQMASAWAIHTPSVPSKLQPFTPKALDADTAHSIEHELLLAQSIRQAVGEGLAVYLRLLHDPLALVRQQAAHLIALFPEYAVDSVPLLQAALDVESIDALRSGLLLALGLLLPNDPLSWAFLAEHLHPDQSAAVRSAAAFALAYSAGAAMPDAAVEVVVDIVQQFSLYADDPPLQEAFAALVFPWETWPGDAFEVAVDALWRLGPERGVAVLLRLLPTMQDPQVLERMLQALIDLAFPLREPSGLCGHYGLVACSQVRLNVIARFESHPYLCLPLSGLQSTVLRALLEWGAALNSTTWSLYGPPVDVTVIEDVLLSSYMVAN